VPQHVCCKVEAHGVALVTKMQQQPSHWSANKLSAYSWKINKKAIIGLTEGYRAKTRLGSPGLMWFYSSQYHINLFKKLLNNILSFNSAQLHFCLSF